MRLTEFGGLTGLVFLDHDDAQAVVRRALLKLRERQRAIVIVGNESRGGFLAALRGEIDDALHISLDEEGQKVNAARGRGGVGRKSDHGLAGAFRDASRLLDAGGEDRADDQLGAFVHGGLRRRSRACGRGVIVLDDDAHVVLSGLEIGKLRGVAQRGADARRPRRLGQRHDQRDLDGTLADELARLAGGRRERLGCRRTRGRRAELKIGAFRSAPFRVAGAKQRCRRKRNEGEARPARRRAAWRRSSHRQHGGRCKSLGQREILFVSQVSSAIVPALGPMSIEGSILPAIARQPARDASLAGNGELVL